jgi:hypothetical protein
LEINSEFMRSLHGKTYVYTSYDTLVQEDYDVMNWLTVLMYDQSPGDLPPHTFSVKVGTIVMLTSSLEPKNELHKGTRLMVRSAGPYTKTAVILSGAQRGKTIVIPPLDLISHDKCFYVPFKVTSCLLSLFETAK